MQQEINKKYIILENETLEHHGKTLYRIQAVKDFSDVNAGDKGGWIEREKNLSQKGDCWVYDEAKVYDNANVSGEAKILNYAEIYDNAYISGYVYIFFSPKIYGFSIVNGNAQVYGNAHISGGSYIYGNAEVYGYAQVFGNAEVYGYAQVFGNAVIKEKSDYKVFKNTWSSGRYFTYTKSNKMWKVGCFYGTGEELIRKAYKDNELSGKMYEAYVKFVENLETLEEKYSKS